jgi:hypothetical protein
MHKNLKERKDVEKKNKEENKENTRKQEMKSVLSVYASVPTKVSSFNPCEVQLTIKNLGVSQIKNLIVSACSTPGLKVKNPNQSIEAISPLEIGRLAFPLSIDETAVRGTYVLMFITRAPAAYTKISIWDIYLTKSALLTEPGSTNAEPIKNWLTANSINYDELSNAEDLGHQLLNYDLLIITSGVHLSLQSMRNIACFVENGQSLLIIGNVIAIEQKLLAEVLGYAELKYEFSNVNESRVRVHNNQHFITQECNAGDQIPIKVCQGRACTSEVATGKVLLEASLPFLVINELGEGRVAYTNLPINDFTGSIGVLLKKTIEWLQFRD